MTVLQTILLGIAASFVAGLIWWLISGDRNGGGILLSVVVRRGDRLPHQAQPRRQLDEPGRLTSSIASMSLPGARTQRSE